jgi:hypothetical protein
MRTPCFFGPVLSFPALTAQRLFSARDLSWVYLALCILVWNRWQTEGEVLMKKILAAVLSLFALFAARFSASDARSYPFPGRTIRPLVPKHNFIGQ